MDRTAASPVITRDDLAALLEAKDEAARAFSAAAQACREASGRALSLDERITLDLAQRRALTAATAADAAYDAALKAFLIQQSEAA